jgi:uncharacterized protein involved in tolerance to divalent cations
MSDHVLALTTLPDGFDTTLLAQDLVAAGLAACVTILPAVRSVYTWKGVPQVETEQQLLLSSWSSRSSTAVPTTCSGSIAAWDRAPSRSDRPSTGVSPDGGLTLL